MPAHTRQILQSAPRPPPAAGGWNFCAGKQLACHLLPPPASSPYPQAAPRAAVGWLMLLCHRPERSFSLSIAQATGILSVWLMALVQTNGKSAWYEWVVIISKWMISSVLLIFLNKSSTTFLEDVYIVSGLFHHTKGFTPLMSVFRGVERIWPQSSVHEHIVSDMTFIP